MKNLRRLLIALLWCVSTCWVTAQEAPELLMEGLSSEGMIEFDESSGVAMDPVGVRLTYGDVELTARRVQVDRSSSEVMAEGNVRIQRGKELWVGDRVRYNFSSRELDANSFRVGQAPFFAAGDGLSASITNQVHTATNAVLTTDDVARPFYRVRAKQIRFATGQYIEAKGATLYLGKVPVMYFPKYRRYLDRSPNHFSFLPGYRTLYGPYILGTYYWSVATNVSAALHFDYRAKRGPGVGPDLAWDVGRWGVGDLRTYYTPDDDPDVDPNGKPIEPDRYRAAFSHSAFIHTNFTAKVAVEKQSDAYVTRDFYESEYRNDPQPNTFLELDRQWANFSLNFLVQAQVNDFFQTVERLPDVKLTGLRQQLGISPFYYESETSLGYQRFRRGDYEGTNYAAVRADTLHQILLPQTFFGWLNVTPRVGGRFTYYGALDDFSSSSGDDDLDRWVFNTGAEVSTKISRVWQGAENRLFQVSGLRHILEPSVNYVYVPEPNRRPAELPQFDQEFYSFELQPVDFPDYNSIDSVDSNNVFRFGLRNKLQTKRDGAVDNLVNWGVYTDWRVKPRDNQRTYSDVYSDLDFKPRSWLTFNSEIRYDINTTTWRMANHTATIQPNNIWHWKVGHRYLQEIPGYDSDSGNNLFLSSLFFKLNENWAFRMVQHFEARDGTMEEQYYTVYRDLRSWTAAFTFRVRDDRDGPTDYTIAVSLSLKAYPRFRVGEDRDKAALLMGG